MTRRQLDVYIDQVLVGVLSENTGIWSFQYSRDWTSNGFALAPGLPLQAEEIVDTGSIRPVQWFFDNLLPEEAARAQLINSITHTTSLDAWDLLSLFGAESAGALSLLPPGTALAEGSLKPLTNEELEQRIQAMPRQPLAANAPKKMSVAGAQQKLLVVVGEDGALFEPVGAFASTHILKPDAASAHYPCSAVNEWFCARLAQKLGLDVPDVELRFVPSPVYIIKRFDRDFSTSPVSRLHALDATQLLSLSAGAKYTKSGVASLVDISQKTRGKLAARIALFRWTLFNILVGNSDAHLKNISLFAGKFGYMLAPHYDLLSTAAWSVPGLVGASEAKWPDIALSYPVGGARTYADLKPEHMEEFASQLGVPKSAALREYRKLVHGILPAANELLAEFETRNDVPPEKRAGQLQMLRTIIHMCIGETVQKLKQPDGKQTSVR
jgi:serine/threonine-protein kinase HipA